MRERFPLYVANKAESPNADLAVYDKFSGELATRVALADAATIDRALAAGLAAVRPMAALPSYRRREILEHCVRRFEERKDELALALAIEAGKPITDARGEVTRLVDTFRIAAGESTRQHGEVMTMDITPRAKSYRGMWKRVPIGLCTFVTPFNFPLNLVAHKIAPALAVGCPFVLKPASSTPVGALLIGEVLAELDLPAGAFSILPCRRQDADVLATDPRSRLLSFTGSAEVGWDLKARAGKKRVSLELGGNAAVIVDEDADIEDAAARIIFGAFYQSGQSCISVQRVIAHEKIAAVLEQRLTLRAKTLISGDPKDDETFIGPVISEKEAIRIESWVALAVAAGGRLLCGGGRKGSIVEPTLLADVPRTQPVVAKEVFGPVAVISRFTDFDEALREVDDSDFGLQAGIFTRDIHKAMRAWDRLDVGGVVIGDVPSFRVDHMPYGGVKDSGQGREGVPFAMEEMTEIRMLAIRDRSLA